MKFLVALATLLSVAVAVPAAPATLPKNVKIISVKPIGSGCPKGTYDVSLSPSGELLDVAFSAFYVQTGPGTKAADWRKNCKIALTMSFPPEYSFSILDTRFLGFAQIAKGAKGTCEAVYTIVGNGQSPVTITKELKGKYEGTFDMDATVGVQAWSGCGGQEAILNLNAMIYLSPTNLPGYLGVDNIEQGVKTLVRARLGWKVCKK